MLCLVAIVKQVTITSKTDSLIYVVQKIHISDYSCWHICTVPYGNLTGVKIFLPIPRIDIGCTGNIHCTP